MICGFGRCCTANSIVHVLFGFCLFVLSVSDPRHAISPRRFSRARCSTQLLSGRDGHWTPPPLLPRYITTESAEPLARDEQFRWESRWTALSSR